MKKKFYNLEARAHYAISHRCHLLQKCRVATNVSALYVVQKLHISEKVYFDQLSDFPTCEYHKTASLENYAIQYRQEG